MAIGQTLTAAFVQTNVRRQATRHMTVYEKNTVVAVDAQHWAEIS